jgi:hypothetical protein
MVTFEHIALEANRLSVEDRKRLIALIVDSLIEPQVTEQPSPRRPLMDFAGIGAHAREQRAIQDAQEYIHNLCSEWDDSAL